MYICVCMCMYIACPVLVINRIFNFGAFNNNVIIQFIILFIFKEIQLIFWWLHLIVGSLGLLFVIYIHCEPYPEPVQRLLLLCSTLLVHHIELKYSKNGYSSFILWLLSLFLFKSLSKKIRRLCLSSSQTVSKFFKFRTLLMHLMLARYCL